MNAVFADTFYFVALLNERDAAHGQAASLRRSLRQPLVTTEWVLAETAGALSGGHLRGGFVRLARILQAAGPDAVIVPATSEMFRAGFDLFASRPDKEWSLTDCISFAVMQDLGLKEALTGDHHFTQAGFRILLKG